MIRSVSLVGWGTGMLEFSPTMGFVQPGGEFLLQMKFKPDESALLKQGGRYVVKKEVSCGLQRGVCGFHVSIDGCLYVGREHRNGRACASRGAQSGGPPLLHTQGTTYARHAPTLKARDPVW
jgi:hypothetical protein